MFGDLLGNMEEKQRAVKEALAQIEITETAGDGAVTVTVNANREVLNIALDREALDWDDVEQVEDLLVVAVNGALSKAAEREAAETQRLLKDMLPPGLDWLFGQ